MECLAHSYCVSSAKRKGGGGDFNVARYLLYGQHCQPSVQIITSVISMAERGSIIRNFNVNMAKTSVFFRIFKNIVTKYP